MSSPNPTLAVVTGGSRGIGLSIAKRLATKHDILIVSRTSPSEDSVAELKNIRPDAVIHYVVGLDCTETQKACGFQRTARTMQSRAKTNKVPPM
jgi:NAD(P)-dependent dehydrogenase (short-subunit alcohol dehydrogenase family)